MIDAFAHVLPWTEEEYLALGETPARVELFDGCLLVSPTGNPSHQRVLGRLYLALSPAARAAGLQIFGSVNVRVGPARIAIPDLVIVTPIDRLHRGARRLGGPADPAHRPGAGRTRSGGAGARELIAAGERWL